MKFLISIIILNYKQKELTEKCLNSLKKVKYPKFEIIVVDNNSDDGSVEYLKTKFPNIKIIANNENSFFAKGNNIGVRYAKGKYILLLNNDVIVEKDFLKELVKKIKSKDVAAVCSYDKNLPFRNRTLNLILYHVEAKTDSNNIFYAPGYCVMYKKDLTEKPFDEDYTIYGEDTYLSWLFRLKGYKIQLAEKSKIFHYGSKTTGYRSFRHIYLGERNRIMNFFIFFNIANIIKIFPLLFFGIIIRIIIELFYNPAYSFYRTVACFWILGNMPFLLKKRKHIQSQRKVDDKPILNTMSYKMLRNSKVALVINFLSCIYCKILNIETIELKK